MTAQVDNLVDALRPSDSRPAGGTLHELAGRTDYSVEHVLFFIGRARVNGINVIARPDPGGTIYDVGEPVVALDDDSAIEENDL